MNIVAVTSCITGIAHTYMAAEALERAAKKAGHTITVETQGSAGSAPMKQSVIDAADVVIFAADLEVKQRARFNGKPLVRVGVQRALAEADKVIAEALKSLADGSAEIAGAGEEAPASPAPKAPKAEAGEKKGFLKGLFG